jgi:hypothetical protein
VKGKENSASGSGLHSICCAKKTRIGFGGGKLYVYTVTSGEIEEASGSPELIPESDAVIVLDLN